MVSAVLAKVRTYEDLHDAMRARAEALQISRVQLDEIAGTQPGYIAKLLAPKPIRKLGPMSLTAILGALALELWVVGDDRALELIGRNQKTIRANPIRALKRHRKHWLSDRPELARALALARWQRLAPRTRSRIARETVRARWKRRRKKN